jgi:alpha-tubulin suppressor-like RCC1 family protein
VGDGHACAVTEGGGVKCWGANSDGQLGNGTTSDSSTPVDVSGLSSGVEAVAAGGKYNDFGGSHTCALTDKGAVLCWGNNDEGQLGNGSEKNSPKPVAVTGLTSGVIAIVAGGSHTCALLKSGRAKCWGDGIFGQVGDTTQDGADAPVFVEGANHASAIATGTAHTCARTDAGTVSCWGWGDDGQIGDGSRKDRLAPVSVK